MFNFFAKFDSHFILINMLPKSESVYSPPKSSFTYFGPVNVHHESYSLSYTLKLCGSFLKPTRIQEIGWGSKGRERKKEERSDYEKWRFFSNFNEVTWIYLTTPLLWSFFVGNASKNPSNIFKLRIPSMMNFPREYSDQPSFSSGSHIDTPLILTLHKYLHPADPLMLLLQ